MPVPRAGPLTPERGTGRRLEPVEPLSIGQLADAFNCLLGLRLSARLEKARLHKPLDNFIRPDEVSKLERDLLKDSLQIVKRFRETIRHHFQLNRF